MLTPDKLSFRPLQHADLPRLYAWRLAPHVRRWWDAPASYDALIEQLRPRLSGQHPARPFLILYDAQPIGYIQYFPINAWDEYRAAIQVEEPAAGVDLFIGEPEYLHQGLGAPLLRQFLKEIVFADAAFVNCLIDPDPENAAAIKAYEKAGFHYLKTVYIPALNETQYLMRITRADAL